MASEGQEILSIALSVTVRSDRYGSTLAISSRGWEDSDGGEYDDAAFSEDVSEHSDPPTSGSEVALWGRSVQAGHSAREDPWEAAKARFSADLEPSEQTIFNNTTLENLFRVTNGAVRDDEEESRLLTVSRKLGPLVAAVESFGTAIDILARIDLASIWGSIKVVLQIARTHEKSHDQVIDTLGRVGDLLPRLREFVGHIPDGCQLILFLRRLRTRLQCREASTTCACLIECIPRRYQPLRPASKGSL